MKNFLTTINNTLSKVGGCVVSFFKFFIDFFKDQYKKNPQILWVPILLLIWVISFPVIWAIDPTATLFKSDVFQIPIYGILIFAITLLVAWQTMRIIFSSLYRYAKKYLKKDFKNLTEWEKIKIYYLVFFSLVFALIFLYRIL